MGNVVPVAYLTHWVGCSKPGSHPHAPQGLCLAFPSSNGCQMQCSGGVLKLLKGHHEGERVSLAQPT